MPSPTLLEYLNDSYKFGATANVVKLEELPGQDENSPIAGKRFSIILDTTIFYPQGGGQPFDTGTIISQNGKFIVKETRFNDGIVFHTGEYESGTFHENDKVELNVNTDRRMLHCRLHSAGHLIDLAMINSGYKLIPTKGYHFPDGPYVEYAGDIPIEQRNELCIRLEEEIKKLIAENTEVRDFIVSTVEELKKYCDHIPDYLPKDKPIRVVSIANYHCPCGGTHVKKLSDLPQIKVSKIKVKGGNVRVSYNFATGIFT